MKKINVVAMGINNLGSLFRALEKIGAKPVPVNCPDELLGSERLILPGVGTFSEGMMAIERLGLGKSLVDFSKLNRGMLGICLGMQLMFQKGHEQGTHLGLGIFEGEVKRLETTEAGLKLPHMGWADVKSVKSSHGLFGAPVEAYYFLHSYVAHAVQKDEIAGTFEFGENQVAAVHRGQLYGVQFHPEKSGDAGLNLLEKFCQQT
jgi:glutamine amidotransferase